MDTDQDGGPQRPGLSRIDTSGLSWNNLPTSQNIDTLSPFSSSRPLSALPADDHGQLLNPAIITTTTASSRSKPRTSHKALNETRKLLSHLLFQLADRKKPPHIIHSIPANPDASVGGIGLVAETLKGVVKNARKTDTKSGKGIHRTDYQDDSDEENNEEFTTDETYEMLTRLKDVLNLSINQGWRIFNDGAAWPREDEDSGMQFGSTFRRSRRGSKSMGIRSRSASPQRGQIDVPELLSFCISILASIVLEDCRYRVGSPRPSRPPNSLQILTLNIAQFLVFSHRHDPKIISQIASAMIPAFATFPVPMHPRLISFFEIGILRVTLHNLEQLQGFPQQEKASMSPDEEYTISIQQPDNPLVSIQIEEVGGDEEAPALSLPSIRDSAMASLQSSNNPNQSPYIYHLSYFIPPLLNALLESLQDSSLQDSSGTPNVSDSLPRFVRLFELIKATKVDAYNDLLEIIAFQGPMSRRLSIAFLAKLYPKVVGHSVISSPLLLPSFRSVTDTRKHPYLHHFVPWFFSSSRRHVRFNLSMHDDCRVCDKPLNGFALMCPLCMLAVHFDCYDDPFGNYQLQYYMDEDRRVQRVAMHRFSNLTFTDSGSIISKSGHHFTYVNWFTLCLCYGCKKPLWGHTMQGVKCLKCSMPFHSGCLATVSNHPICASTVFTSKDFTISEKEVKLSLSQYLASAFPPRASLEAQTYEELSIYHSILDIQLEIFQHGVQMGSILISPRGRDPQSATYELQQMKRATEDLLGSGRLSHSFLTQQYTQDNATLLQKDFFFDWSFLEYLTSDLKASSPHASQFLPASPDLLAVGQADEQGLGHTEVDILSLEMVSISHLRQVLKTDLGLQSEFAVRHMLNHLLHLSFLERLDDNAQPIGSVDAANDVNCLFPLPLGLDYSVNVETLVSAVEASLGDLDLATNEFGFLLLTRRLWPNGLSSDFIQKRLCERVFLWILGEDESLATILREYVAKQTKLPGVRMEQAYVPWPQLQDSRLAPASLSMNGGDYVACRRSLHARYAIPWLLAIHNLNPELYAEIAYNACSEVVNQHDHDFIYSGIPNADAANGQLERFDEILRAIMKLCQASVSFSVFDDVFLRWIEQTVQLIPGNKALPSLGRIFTNQSESVQRSSSIVNQPSSGRYSSWTIDPLRAILDLSSHGSTSFSKGLTYLLLLTRSGVDVSIASLKQFASLIDTRQPSFLENTELLLKSIIQALWLRSLGRQELQKLISSLHSNLAGSLRVALTSGSKTTLALSVIRLSLACCLLIYGCERTSLIKNKIIYPTDIQNISSRRKVQKRASEVVDPLTVDPQILNSLETYLSTEVEEVRCLAIKFLYMFLSESPLLEGFEIDNFILRNGKFLCLCVWESYGIQREDICTARTTVLLRSLVVDIEPFHQHVEAALQSNQNPVPQRLAAVTRLFRMVSDVTSPSFGVEGRQWKSTVMNIFYFFFSSLWSDPESLIRLAARSFSATLLPVHFHAITQCWNESLGNAPVIERLKLVSFLIQLHPHFPSWKVIYWDCLIEALDHYVHDTSEVNRDEDELFGKESSSLPHDADTSRLRVSIMILSLQMLADGVEIDAFSVMKLKTHLVQLIGFTKIVVMPPSDGHVFTLQFEEIYDIAEEAYPCIEELVHTMDAPHKVQFPCSVLACEPGHYHGTVNMLIGATFVDVVLSIFGSVRDLTSLPVITLKSLIEILYIIIHKVDFDHEAFHHLRPALRRGVLCAVEMLSKDISYEVRQLSMSVGQAAIKRWRGFLGAAVGNILLLVVTEVAEQGSSSQDALVVHGKLLIGTTLNNFCNSGLLYSIMKRSLPPRFFTVVKQVMSNSPKDSGFTPENLCEQLLRDTLTRAEDCDPSSFQTVIQNINHFVDTVYSRDYTQEMMIYVGQQLTHLARRLADGTIIGADSTPLIEIALVLIEANRKIAKDMLAYLDTTLRVTLNRLTVTTPCLVKVLKVTSGMKPRAVDTSSNREGIVGVLCELLVDGFRAKTKILPATMAALIESLETLRDYSTFSVPQLSDSVFRNMVEDAYNFLQQHVCLDENTVNDFNAMFATASLLLRNTLQDPLLLQRLTNPLSESKGQRMPPTLRTWNVLLLAALRSDHPETRTALFPHFRTFAHTYSNSLGKYVYSGITSLEGATTDVNQAHISIKLWILLAHTLNEASQSDTGILAVWNELWAPYEAFLDVLEVEARAGLNPTLVSLTATSIADVLLYMRNLQTSLSLEVSSHIHLLNRLKALSGDASVNKIAKAIRSLSEPPVQLDTTAILNQIGKELIAAEKLRVMELKRENGKLGAERFRRDIRFQT